jgi:hypothetical protein
MGAVACGPGVGGGGVGAVGGVLGAVSEAAGCGLGAGVVGVGLLHPAKRSKANIIIVVFIAYVPPIINC